MWDLIVSVPNHCLSFYLILFVLLYSNSLLLSYLYISMIFVFKFNMNLSLASTDNVL